MLQSSCDIKVERVELLDDFPHAASVKVDRKVLRPKDVPSPGVPVQDESECLSVIVEYLESPRLPAFFLRPWPFFEFK